MSDTNENSPTAVLAAQTSDPTAIMRENADLRAKLAALQNNVVSGQFRGEAPRYQLNEPGFYDDTWFPKDAIIDYLDTPNMSMVPMNEPARRAMEEHIAFLEHGARAKAAMSGRQYFGQVNDRNVLLDQAMQDAKAAAAAAPSPVISMPVPHGQVPAMPHTDDAKAIDRRGPGRPRKVLSSEGPPSTPDRGAPTLPAVVGRMVG